ncbi:MAG: tRNA (adenosine(37)-N6)-dimethylallyltransferase MiaA [Cryomorphaceae bacterium]|jgi:tRNA dimethylallyltransferase|nr:tRNA (adenosine(37)-N6)-dimethylallyltransferase MiaA [Cryomorphaceae bacterium]MBT3503350.1 tRNA (adenosine(37)-N6)-dimethylallyltransferase MiaA [Cryomorphaceae bacterium]MBT4221997.1 tRNA (adenosine(37)-N6)-dimethylallyltransferase MiaA [Cryomorphaceae bacterium]MBT4293999.1 tRNA (adenosine(37)-N6)-dimethylallyltransferase MiaA [Cryomorphaceae bacterium]MBT4517428.1 tRNA (adenosine(37)-N6)-dimethylallyltransferase MiaA [Cryomorphaceae bacterium]
MRKNKNLIYIAGPTGIGKTNLSIEIAKKLNSEILSCDSRQFYKELNIGTSPPSYSQLNDVKHHFIHNKSIHDIYNVGNYEKEAITLINKLFEDKDVLILVGGSGLYADSIMYGIDEFPEIPTNIRESFINEYNSSGLELIQNKLKKLDIKYYNEVDLNNSNRIIRALEIIEFTGKEFSLFRTKKQKERVFQSQVIVMECEREKLYNRINTRVDNMIEKGLEKEVLELRDFKHLNTLNTVGYKEFFNYFEGKSNYLDTLDKIKQNTRNYAKRQVTWLKRYKKSIKVHCNQEVDKIINEL